MSASDSCETTHLTGRVEIPRAFGLLAVLVTSVLGLILMVANPAYASTTFTVDSVRDEEDATPRDGVCDSDPRTFVDRCTLRAAIEEANATDGTDTINFNIGGGSGVKTIQPATRLPAINDSVTINGYSQPGARPNNQAVGTNAVLKIELDGTNAGAGANGLHIQASKTVVKGLAINRFPVGGIYVVNGTSIAIQGNFIGTDPGGTVDLGNRFYGVFVTSVTAPANTTIGGTTPAARNLISGNGGAGIEVGRTTTITGNLIGTDKNGTADLGNSENGVRIGASDSIVGGTVSGARNVISGNDHYGVVISGSEATGNKVEGNYIGTDATGAKYLGNVRHGVRIIDASNNTIGGTASGAGNVISGNRGSGVEIRGSFHAATGNEVQGNFVGTNASGTQDLGNAFEGVTISNADENTVGGTTSGARNVISGNNDLGVFIGHGASGNVILGNYIGTDVAGAQDLGNGFDGVRIAEASNNTVGGTVSAARNIISGNGDNGVMLFGSAATGNKVQGNYIGTEQDGTGDLGNSKDGVVIAEAPGNFVGGTDAEDGTADGVVQALNVISGNDRHGVVILGNGATGNRILGNSIFSNTNLGIDLDRDGRTANDPQDPDTGPNNLQNFPRLTSAITSGTQTTIQGRLNSTPNSTFTIQFFRNPPGTDEGKTLIGEKSVTTNSSGTTGTFSFSPAQALSGSQRVTATATSASGDTSEFSDPKDVSVV